MKNIVRTALLAVATCALAAATPALFAQERTDSESAGRGWPLGVTETMPVGAGGPEANDSEAVEGTPNRQGVPAWPRVVAAEDGEVPEGIEPLERDIFNSDDFYADRDLWMDQRYYRCNSPMALESVWGAYNARTETGDNFPETVSWGHCDRDYPREDIVSPYPFETAQEHYEVLLEEAVARGGPTQHTMATVPNWTGRYDEDFASHPQWFYMSLNQMPTILSLLTPEYQTRMVQEAYHQANTNAAQWPSSYCWPEGLLRWYSRPAVRMYDFMVTDQNVQLLAGVADNFLRNILVGREFKTDGAIPRLGEDVPRWYGETIGFWDEDVLVTWTSNVQGWVTHSAFEHSNQIQLVEIYSTQYDENGGVSGVLAETIVYDPEALVEPVRMHRQYIKVANLNDPDVDPYIFVECNQTIYPIDGVATPTTPGQVIDFTVPDMFGRPWAQIWERYHEEGMTRPEAQGLFGF